MRSVRVSADQCRYLRSAAYLSADLQQVVQESLSDSEIPANLSLTAAVAERFRDCFTERLAQAGFDSGYNLSPEGAILEELIDRFTG